MERIFASKTSASRYNSTKSSQRSLRWIEDFEVIHSLLFSNNSFHTPGTEFKKNAKIIVNVFLFKQELDDLYEIRVFLYQSRKGKHLLDY